MFESADEWARRRLSDDRDEQYQAAAESLDVETWFEIIERYPDLRFWVAQNKAVPIEVLAELAGDADPRVRGMVADKRKLSPELLERLASDSSDSVRMSVARHRKTPKHVLRTLAEEDPWDEIRRVSIERLAKDGDE